MRAITLVDSGADCVAVADFNDDGAFECVVGRAQSSNLAVYDASGERSQSWIELDSLPVAVTAGDFDTDGVPELAVAMIDGRLSPFTSDLALTFSLARTVALPGPPRGLAVGLVAGKLHLVVASGTSVHLIDPTDTEPEMPAVSALVAEVAEHLQGLAENNDGYLAIAPITQREREVVGLAIRGMHAREIGSRLFIGERTVETHLDHAYRKLGVRSRFELLVRLSSRNRSAPRK